MRRTGQIDRRLSCLALAITLLCSGPVHAAQETPRVRVDDGAFVAVIVEDLDAMADWYQLVLRVREVNRFEGAAGVAVRVLRNEGLFVELIRLGPAERPTDRHPGLFKSGFHVADLDAASDWLQQNGVEMVGEIFTDDALQARSLVFRDPEGNRLQMFEALAPDGAEAATELRREVSAIEQLFEVDFSTAWRERDADALAALWVEHGDWSNVIGSRRVVTGRDGVRGVWEVGLGDRAAAAELAIEVDVSHVRLVGRDTAIADVLMHFAPETDGALSEAFVMVLTRAAEGWRVVSARAARVPATR